MNTWQIRDKILKLNGLVSQRKAAEIIGCSQSEIARCCRYHGIEWIRQYRQQSGPDNHNFKDGLGRSTVERATWRAVKSTGRCPKTCERCGYTAEQELPRHHKDRDRSNNNPSNIEVLCWGCHNREHVSEKVRDELGRFII